MKLSKKISVDRIVKRMKDFSGADVKAVATEAGYRAIRENRTMISEKDFIEGIEKVKAHEKEETEHLNMFG